MTLEKIERLISILNIERKARGGKNKIDIATTENGRTHTVTLTVDEALSVFIKMRQEMLREEGDYE